MDPGLRRDDERGGFRRNDCEAGKWIPAFAGMTARVDSWQAYRERKVSPSGITPNAQTTGTRFPLPRKRRKLSSPPGQIQPMRRTAITAFNPPNANELLNAAR